MVQSGTRSLAMAMARAQVFAIALFVVGCGTATAPRATPIASPSGPMTSASPTATTPVAASASTGQRCGDSRGSEPEPQYAFPHISIPLGSDACQDIGPFTIPNILYVTNDGSLVAFNSSDYDNQGCLWYGDLATGSMRVAYQAQQTASNRVGLWWPQLAGGHLLWLEYVHDGPDVHLPVKGWAVKDMDLATRDVAVVAQGLTPGHGGQILVNEIRFDGKRIAMTETLASGWRIEIRDLAGKVQASIPAAGDPFDLALVTDGLVYSTGTDNPAIGSVGDMHFWHWTPSGGAKEIGTDVFQINAEDNLAAWVADPLASKGATGYFQSPRLYVANAPFATPQPISPAVSATGSKGIDGMAVGSATVAWWEKENWHDAWQDVLTVWQPGWASPIQIDTEGNGGYRLSVRGGWLVWEEGFGRDAAPLLERIRGVPLSVLTAQRKG